MRAPILAVLLLLLAACQGQAPSPAEDRPVSHGAAVPLVIETVDGPQRLSVELAITSQAQQRGLMGRPRLADGQGMLFPFALPRLASFWMKDTPQPLDLLFIAPDGTVSAVLSGKPDDETPISTGTPVIAVIEIAGGNAARLGISEGSRVRWGDCPPGAPRDPPGRIADPRRFCPH